MQTLRYAVIGRNFVAEDFLAAAAARDDVRLCAVCSRREDTGRVFAAKHGAPKVYTDVHALADDPDIDFVYIATPNICHEPQTLALLRGGKHVLVEKPAATDAAAFGRMTACADRFGRVLMEAMMSVHMPALQKAAEWLGRIAPVRGASVQYCQYSSRYDKFKRGIVENAFDPTLGNGALMDIGVYCVELMTYLAGAPEQVSARSIFLPDSIDACGTITASYSGALWTLSYSKVDDGALGCEIRGELGRLTLDRVSRPRRVTLELRDGTREVYDTPPGSADMAYELADFLACVRGTADALPFRRVSETAIAVMDEARRQADIDFCKK